jgi:histidinol phosphatase-like enzyme (inositol monophosphatase family)
MREDAPMPADAPRPGLPGPPPPPGLLDEAVDLVRQAGRLTLEWFRSAELSIEQKHDGTPVTEADRAAERFLRDELAARFPDDAIVGEEHADRDGTSGRTWVIDPIDGTKAFTRGVPLYTNLLALEDEHGPLLGVINMPALGETVYAGRGAGCFVDGRPAQVSDRDQLEGSYLSACGYDYWSDELLGAARDAGAVLRTWGDGYGYALVATGRVDAMCDPIVARWDVAPMPVILHEAGGRFTDLDGTATTVGGTGLATNGRLHEAWLERLGALPRVRPGAA